MKTSLKFNANRNNILNNRATKRALKEELSKLSKQEKTIKLKQTKKSKPQIDILEYQIRQRFKKKLALFQRYRKIACKESLAIIDHGVSVQQKLACDILKWEIEAEIVWLDKERVELQSHRDALLSEESYKLKTAEETKINDLIQNLHEHYIALLDKIYLRYLPPSDNQEINRRLFSEFIPKFYSLQNPMDITNIKLETNKRLEVGLLEGVLNLQTSLQNF